ncbi:MAG: hypothetical protein VW239_00220 [Candidatus Nanopelagicales bacterium]
MTDVDVIAMMAHREVAQWVADHRAYPGTIGPPREGEEKRIIEEAVARARAVQAEAMRQVIQNAVAETSLQVDS